jgi:hypothetical protein
MSAAKFTGGTVTESGGYVYHAFTSVGTTNIVPIGAGADVEYLIVGGGGGGGSRQGGGGGAGGLRTGTMSITITTAVTVGVGGAGGTSGGRGANGGDSSLGATIATGGGGGGGRTTGNTGSAGGSGGGGAGTAVGGAGTSGEGNDGGQSTPILANSGGGGGGAGTVGEAALNTTDQALNEAGDGGAGLAPAGFGGFGSGGWFAGGGGGGLFGNNAPGAGGQGGGGVGQFQTTGSPGAGVANTGGGGGGSGDTSVAGGAGGSGVVIIRYESALNHATATLTITGFAPMVSSGADVVCEFGFPPDMPADYRARIEYAVSETEPSATSGLWSVAGYLTGPGEVVTPPQVPGATVWVRARGEAPQCRPSAWTEAQSIVVPVGGGLILSATLFLSGAIPSIGWVEGTGVGGIRIERSVGAIGHTVSYSTETEMPSGIQQYTFPASNVSDGEEIYVRLTPFSGFEFGGVAGDQGPAVTRYAARAVEGQPMFTFLSAARTSPGDCGEADDYLTHRVTWFTDGDMTGFEVWIEVQEDGGAWTLLSDDVPDSGTYDDVITGFVHSFADGGRVDYRYRVLLVRTADTSIIAEEQSSVIASYLLACESS